MSIKFGTSGWRAVIADEFTFANVRNVTEAVCRYLKDEPGSRGRLIVGHDTRFMGEKFSDVAAEIISAKGLNVLRCTHPVPTPTVAHAIRALKTDGAMNFTAKDSPEPIGVLLVHGTADGNVRYEGGAPRDSTGRSGERVDASVRDAIDYYLDRNGLRGYPETKTDGKVRLDSYATNKDGKPSSAPLRVITLEGGGHAWPGMPNQARPGADRPFPFPTAREIWLFFVELRRAPGSPSAPQGR